MTGIAYKRHCLLSHWDNHSRSGLVEEHKEYKQSIPWLQPCPPFLGRQPAVTTVIDQTLQARQDPRSYLGIVSRLHISGLIPSFCLTISSSTGTPVALIGMQDSRYEIL